MVEVIIGIIAILGLVLIVGMLWIILEFLSEYVLAAVSVGLWLGIAYLFGGFIIDILK